MNAYITSCWNPGQVYAKSLRTTGKLESKQCIYSVNTSPNNQLQRVSHLQIDEAFLKYGSNLIYELLRGKVHRHRLHGEDLQKSQKWKFWPDWHKSPSALRTQQKYLSQIVMIFILLPATALCCGCWALLCQSGVFSCLSGECCFCDHFYFPGFSLWLTVSALYL